VRIARLRHAAMEAMSDGSFGKSRLRHTTMNQRDSGVQ
jgi:hypothetical protein